MALFADPGSIGPVLGAKPFAGLGRPVSTTEDLRTLWSWRAEPKSIFLAGSDVEIPGYKALTRSDSGSVLAVQKDSYSPIQYADGLSLLESAVGSGEITLETAGTFSDGAKAWALAKVNGAGTEVAGAEVLPYVLFASSHDSSLPLSVLCTPVYVVCQNTLMAAVYGANERFVIRHSGDVDSKLAEARRVISGAREYFGTFNDAAVKLASTRMPAGEFVALAGALFPEPRREGGPTGNSRATQARERLLELYQGAQIARDFAPGSRWAAFSAVTEYLDRDRASRGGPEAAAQSSVWGSAAALRQRAFDLLLVDGPISEAAAA